MCEEDWAAACAANPNETSNTTCPGLIATVVENCPENHVFWDEGAMEWKSTRMDAQEARSVMSTLICTDCGLPYMEFAKGCMPEDGMPEGSDGGMGDVPLFCQEGSHC